MKNLTHFYKWLRFGNEDRFVADNILFALKFRILGTFEYGLRLRQWRMLQEIIKLFTRNDLRRGKFHVLDAGCGKGQSTFFLSQIFENAIVRGVDSDVNRITNARYRLSKVSNKIKSRVSFDVLDLRKLNALDKYDLIMCSEVLEHIEEDEVVLKNIYNSLKNNGVVIFTVPLEIIPPSPPHIAGRYSYTDLKCKLTKSGFNVDKFRYFSSPYVGEIGWFIDDLCKKKINPLTNVLRLMLYPLLCFFCILDYWIKPSFGHHLLFVAKKDVE